jgi:hypothetical protein
MTLCFVHAIVIVGKFLLVAQELSAEAAWALESVSVDRFCSLDGLSNLLFSLLLETRVIREILG